MVTATETLAGLRARRVESWGAIGFWGGIAGALSAMLLIVYPPQVSPDHFSYPFRGMGFTIAQLFFALQHVTMMLVVAGLLRTAAGHSRLARGGIGAAIVGLLLMSVVELVVISAADAVVGDPLYDTMSSLYGIPTILTATGLVVGGIGILRVGVWRSRTRLLPLILGVYVFVVLTPALFGPNWLGRVAIGLWCLLFALQGWILWRGTLSRTVVES
ncbi:hypothetical protein [Mycetocola sp. 2940]|uniref:hypothetical protein n=1 Tax=Mycetocola sp. 2940 TaxID=3156452 RepID=UPI003397EC45